MSRFNSDDFTYEQILSKVPEDTLQEALSMFSVGLRVARESPVKGARLMSSAADLIAEYSSKSEQKFIHAALKRRLERGRA